MRFDLVAGVFVFLGLLRDLFFWGLFLSALVPVSIPLFVVVLGVLILVSDFSTYLFWEELSLINKPSFKALFGLFNKDRVLVSTLFVDFSLLIVVFVSEPGFERAVFVGILLILRILFVLELSSRKVKSSTMHKSSFVPLKSEIKRLEAAAGSVIKNLRVRNVKNAEPAPVVEEVVAVDYSLDSVSDKKSGVSGKTSRKVRRPKRVSSRSSSKSSSLGKKPLGVKKSSRKKTSEAKKKSKKGVKKKSYNNKKVKPRG